MTRSALNYDRDAVSKASGLVCLEPSKTVQAEKDQADINTIVRQFGLTGQLPQGVRIPQYADFSEAVTDYQTAVNAILQAESSFLELPANIRARFHNDPQAFLEFCSKESNLDEMRSMGLAVPRSDAPGAAIADPAATPPNGRAAKPDSASPSSSPSD